MKGTALLTDFVIGPVELDVTRKFNTEEHKASATAEKIEGRLQIKINKEGKPRVKKLALKRPKDIKTSGSTARGFGSNGNVKAIVKKSIKEVNPTATKKLVRLAR